MPLAKRKKKNILVLPGSDGYHSLQCCNNPWKLMEEDEGARVWVKERLEPQVEGAWGHGGGEAREESWKTKRERSWWFGNKTVGNRSRRENANKRKAERVRDSCIAKLREKGLRSLSTLRRSESCRESMCLKTKVNKQSFRNTKGIPFANSFQPRSDSTFAHRLCCFHSFAVNTDIYLSIYLCISNKSHPAL